MLELVGTGWLGKLDRAYSPVCFMQTVLGDQAAAAPSLVPQSGVDANLEEKNNKVQKRTELQETRATSDWEFETRRSTADLVTISNSISLLSCVDHIGGD
jgi:hypothetical protein